jgi:hypothetical protein
VVDYTVTNLKSSGASVQTWWLADASVWDTAATYSLGAAPDRVAGSFRLPYSFYATVTVFATTYWPDGRITTNASWAIPVADCTVPVPPTTTPAEPTTTTTPCPCPRQGSSSPRDAADVASGWVGPREGWRQMGKLTTVIGLVLILALGLVAAVGRPQPARAAGDNLVLVWNEEALESIRKLPPGPTPAARALAIVHTAIYDAWAAYDPLAVGTRLDAKLRQPEAERTQANKDKAVSFAAYLALVDLFPARQAVLAQRMQDLGFAIDGTDTSTAATVGRVAAQAVVDYRRGDGSNQLNGYADTSGYTRSTAGTRS